MSKPSSLKPKKVLDQLRNAIRIKHYAYRTEKTYTYWAKRYILFHNKRPPATMGTPEIEAFLTHLTQVENVAASTQNQAFNAFLPLSQCPAYRTRCSHKPVSPRAFRHCFATPLLKAGYGIRTVLEYLGHKDNRTTMIYTHILHSGGRAVHSRWTNTYS